MALPGPLQSLTDWIAADVLTSPALAWVGLVALVGLGLALGVLIFRRLARWAGMAARELSRRVSRRKQAVGYRILIAPPTGRTSGGAFTFLTRAIRAHMTGFSFDAPYDLARTLQIIGGQTSDGVRAARARLARTDADMIIWGQRVSGKIDGLRVFTLSRAGGLSAADAALGVFYLPGASKLRAEALQPVAAYLLAKRLQPSLGRPEDFRAERLEPVAARLEDLIASAEICDDSLREELEADFSAAALHIGTAQKNLVWLDKVIALRRASLERLGAEPQPGIWAQAKFDLGRAMVAKAETHYDPKAIAEGGEHIRDAIDQFKTDPAIRRAEAAIHAFDKARKLLETRKRFSINLDG